MKVKHFYWDWKHFHIKEPTQRRNEWNILIFKRTLTHLWREATNMNGNGIKTMENECSINYSDPLDTRAHKMLIVIFFSQYFALCILEYREENKKNITSLGIFDVLFHSLWHLPDNSVFVITSPVSFLFFDFIFFSLYLNVPLPHAVTSTHSLPLSIR